MALMPSSITLFLILLPCNLLPCSSARTWIKAGYWYAGNRFPISDINSAPFTHLMCAAADLNSSTFQLSIPSEYDKFFSAFTNTVKRKNPHVVTLLSIGGGSTNVPIFSSMMNKSSYRKSFIDSSITTARSYGFHGLDYISLDSATTESEMSNLDTLLQEWRTAIEAESRNSNDSKLILTMVVCFSPYLGTATFPIDSMRNNLDWVHLTAFDYHTPLTSNFTAATAALYEQQSKLSTDYGVNAWINGGFPSTKLVLGLPFYGYAWTLVNLDDNGIGAPAWGPARHFAMDGYMTYNDIKGLIQGNMYGAVSTYNATYVVNYCSLGPTWISFDDVEVIKVKVAYAREKNLLGYFAWEVSQDDNWLLSQTAAQEGEKHHQNKRHMLLILGPTIALAILVLVSATWYLRERVQRGSMDKGRELQFKQESMLSIGNTENDPNLLMFHFNDIVVATNNFSFENKLGEGGYGPVYKGKLKNGQIIAVKRLSKGSKQGYEEFKNEVVLTAKLQHVNLVMVLGFCVDREEQILIYEYMPNKSLDWYIYDSIKGLILDWKKQVQIIEGIVQGLLYLQEYSRFTVIHRDLKASNILLDNEMKAKIQILEWLESFQKTSLKQTRAKLLEHSK
ncbi:class V chitinase-like [Diospyros lotus]|uniref:class V chitinase-like n=1 Tax=Diospyros lotus TaxID=55363 RepID=UPI0022561728|nr:class V chitinase-like [Diospyros lotus]